MHETFDHTADLGLRATAPDLDGLFAEMGQALFAAVVEQPGEIRPLAEERFEIPGADREYLLFDWLRALLMRFEETGTVFARFAVTVRADGLTATASGEPFDPSRHGHGHEVKAITYHGLKVEPTPGGWLAEVIVDI
jgi:SHS2 domain-containing protein